MNTLYEILEVSENASKEVIEKAYKVLAKRYHPDLQSPENKEKAEQKMKQINEAYDILSDDSKRKNYDDTLRQQREEQKRQEQSATRTEPQTSEQYYTSNDRPNNNTSQQNAYNKETMSKEEQQYRQMQRRKYEEELYKKQEEMQQNMQQQYENAYYDYLRSLGYRIKEGWTWERIKMLFLTIAIMIGVLVILWIFPPTHNILMDLYQNNGIIKVIVNIVLGIFGALFEAIGSGFKSLFNGW